MNQPLPGIQLYHIIHVDRLPSILQYNGLWCDAEIVKFPPLGTTIGMNKIKQRRLTKITLSSYPDLFVGSCVPFYFCPRSIMLYVIHKQNIELAYKGGQGPIIHLVADLHETVSWANTNNQRWVFTDYNAGSSYFSDYNDLNKLSLLNWNAINSTSWMACKDAKQAEFLLERFFPWCLIREIGVISSKMENEVKKALQNASHKPVIKIVPEWYY
jgi:hypothetical protein